MRNGEGKEYDGDGNDMVYSGEFVNGYYDGNGVWMKNGFVCYKGEWKFGYPNGNGVLMNSKGVETDKGKWKNGYLKDGKVVIDFESGKKRICGNQWSMRGFDDRFDDWWNSISKCKRFWYGLLFWIMMIVILSFPFYEIGGYAYMSIRIAFSSDLVIHNCWEWEHIPMWWRWKVKNLKINDNTCSDTHRVRVFDLSQYKNLVTVEIGSDTFGYVKHVSISELNELESLKLQKRTFARQIDD